MDTKYIWDLESEREKKRLEKKKQRKNQKLKEAQKEKKKRIKKKIFKIIKINVLIITIVVLLIIPMIPINTIEISGNKNFQVEVIEKDLGFTSKESILSYFFKQIKSQKANVNYEEVSYKYNLSEKKLSVDVKEAKPLSHDMNLNKYMSSSNKIIKIEENFATPLLNGFTKEEIENINLELSTLKFEIITQIKSIEYQSKEDQILKMQMIDGNTVYIYIQQISQKMPYYQQMKRIIDQNQKGDGNIYLYIGDYYEEK